MTRLFTHKHLAILFSFCFLFVSRSVTAQCNFFGACPAQVRENFNDDSFGFSGSGGFSYNNPDGPGGEGYFQATTTRGGAGYTITTRNFSVGASQTSATFGFTMTGPSVFRYTVKVQNAANQDLTTCTSQNNPSSGSKCITVTSNSLAGQNIRFVISFEVSNGSGGDGTLIFDDFKVDLAEQVATPVVFTSFDARRFGAATQLTWKVGTEENVHHYEVEKNTGTTFNSIGSVPANSQSAYTFADPQTSEGTVQYRIRIVDNDGKYKYSNIISLKDGIASILLKAFPIPARNNITIQHPLIVGNGQIILASGDGRVVRSIIPEKNSMITEIKLDGLNAGIYLLRFDAGDGKLQTLKIIKQ